MRCRRHLLGRLPVRHASHGRPEPLFPFVLQVWTAGGVEFGSARAKARLSASPPTSSGSTPLASLVTARPSTTTQRYVRSDAGREVQRWVESPLPLAYARGDVIPRLHAAIARVRHRVFWLSKYPPTGRARVGNRRSGHPLAAAPAFAATIAEQIPRVVRPCV